MSASFALLSLRGKISSTRVCRPCGHRYSVRPASVGRIFATAAGQGRRATAVCVDGPVMMANGTLRRFRGRQSPLSVGGSLRCANLGLVSKNCVVAMTNVSTLQPVPPLRSVPPAPQPRGSVLVCDFQPVNRQVLAAQVAGSGPYPRAVHSVPDGAAAVDAFASHPADLVLIGIHRCSASGAAALTLLVREHPSAFVVVFGSLQDSQLLIDAMHCGAQGWIIWNTHPRPGRPPAFNTAGTVPATNADITDLELRVLRGMCDGMSDREIGSVLCLPEPAVRLRSRGLLGKLGARNRAQAVAQAFRHGIVT